jgi:hypothetical protein
VGQTTVQNAIRRARRFGLVTVLQRRRRALPSLTNIIRIVYAEWLTWLRRGARRAILGGQLCKIRRLL